MMISLAAAALIALAQAPLEEVCSGINNLHECNAVIEAAQLPLWANRVSRSDSRLVLALDSGESVEFVDDGRYHYRFRECVERVGKCLVVKGANEYLRYIAVDTATGERHVHLSLPRYSPDGRWLAVGSEHGLHIEGYLEIRNVATNSLEFGLTVHDLSELSARHGVCKSPWEGGNWSGADQIRWSGSDEVSFELRCFGGPSQPLTVRRSRDAWVLEWAQP
jgi:hypothetical protein